MLLYSWLFLCGYGLTLEDIKNFRQVGSPCAATPSTGTPRESRRRPAPSARASRLCVGLALAERMLAARFNRDGHTVVDHHTFTIASDGDMEEGISSEASSIAGHLGLGRLIAFYDDNHISIEGDTDLAFSEDVGARYEAYGWHVQHLGEEVTVERVEEAARAAIAVEDRPSLIVCRTHIAYGAPSKQDTAGAHGSPLGEEEIRLTKEGLRLAREPPFYVPQEALEHFRSATAGGAEEQREWEERYARYRELFADEAAELECDLRARRAGAPGRLPQALRDGRQDRHPQGLPGGPPGRRR